eukprot:4060854-Prymnesium_polylepis.1
MSLRALLLLVCVGLAQGRTLPTVLRLRGGVSAAKLVAAAKAESDRLNEPTWIMITDAQGDMVAEEPCKPSMLKTCAAKKAKAV